MQTFLPHLNFTDSLNCLDYRRLGKQRVETKQILTCLTPGYDGGWRNHPAVRMWRGYEPALATYYNISINLWKSRGYNNTMQRSELADEWDETYPPWLTHDFCRAHRSNLLRKDYNYYSQFNWNVPITLPYIWSV